jgi:asparagine synthase (glutamine-hydrolysing)
MYFYLECHAASSLTSVLVGLGHVRLSIIDLATSQQPLSDEEGDIWAVVTGEFYDFERVREELKTQGAKFKTNGDSELLIQL